MDLSAHVSITFSDVLYDVLHSFGVVVDFDLRCFFRLPSLVLNFTFASAPVSDPRGPQLYSSYLRWTFCSFRGFISAQVEAMQIDSSSPEPRLFVRVISG